MIFLELHMKVMDFLKNQITIIEWHREKERGRAGDGQQAKPPSSGARASFSPCNIKATLRAQADWKMPAWHA